MANVLTYRRGTKVRHVETRYNFWGNVMETIDRVVTIVDNPRNPETGRYCSATDFDAHVRVKPDKGDAYDVNVEYIEVYNTIYDLEHDELMQLRKQVTLGSCYLADYNNSFGIDNQQVCDFCEGFGEEIGWSDEQDTPENFALYCEGIEIAA